ncbi:MAG: hypothetical protein ACR2QW_05505 [bacterium]
MTTFWSNMFRQTIQLERILMIASVPVTGVSFFIAWKLVKYLILIGIVAGLAFAGYQFVSSG